MKVKMRRRLRVAWNVLALLAACVVAAACASPEASRKRAGGAGGDVGNRPAQIAMHGGSSQYYETPRIGVQHPSLDPAEQAKRVD